MPLRTGAVVTSRLLLGRDADRRIRERCIGEEAILEAVLKPTMLFYDAMSKAMVAFGKLNEKHILVVFVKEDIGIRVVTAFKTSAKNSPASGTWRS